MSVSWYETDSLENLNKMFLLSLEEFFCVHILMTLNSNEKVFKKLFFKI